MTITPITDPDPRFARILEATYEGTLDCPELDGTRSIEEVLACYRFTARGAPDWLLASSANEPVGVVMFAPGPQPEIRELSYLGLVRSARGRGLGRELLRYAINHANGSGAGWLTLSVDERNAPALALYRGQSFREFDRQAVFFWEP